jgi:hypothetical protein
MTSSEFNKAEIDTLIEKAKADPALLAGAHIGISYYRVKIDSLGRARITRDSDKISREEAIAHTNI